MPPTNSWSKKTSKSVSEAPSPGWMPMMVPRRPKGTEYPIFTTTTRSSISKVEPESGSRVPWFGRGWGNKPFFFFFYTVFSLCVCRWCIQSIWLCISGRDFMCCHTETEAACQICCLTHSQHTDTRPTSPSTAPIMPPKSVNTVTIR